MTVSTTSNKIIYTSDGVTLTYTFPFAVRANGQADINVFTTTTAGVITQLTNGTQYSVTLNAAVAPNPTPVGGSVTLLIAAPASGTLITIRRAVPLTQTTSLANQGTLYQPVLEAMDDAQTMGMQQVLELQGRAIVVSVSDNAPSPLPPAAQRANLVLGFDSSGAPAAVAAAPTGTISSAMIPFVGAASIAAAKAQLGYGSMANENIGVVPNGMGIGDNGAGFARVNQFITAVSTNQSPGAGQHMINYASSGTVVITLPLLSSVFNGYELWGFCLSGTATLSPNVANNFPGLAGGVSIVLTAGQCARLIGDGATVWQIFQGHIPGVGNTQTRTTFTTGSAATYNVPSGCRRLFVRMIGGGGGGGTANTGGAGTAGGTTTFNSINANGGSGGTGGSTVSPGLGGAGGTGGTGSATTRIPGGDGGVGAFSTSSTSLTWVGGAGVGGAGAFGKAGAYGGGGNGGSTGSLAGSGGGSGGGGGAGEYVELIISLPAASYVYTVGGSGPGGTGAAAGGGGLIMIDEYY